MTNCPSDYLDSLYNQATLVFSIPTLLPSSFKNCSSRNFQPSWIGWVSGSTHSAFCSPSAKCFAGGSSEKLVDCDDDYLIVIISIVILYNGDGDCCQFFMVTMTRKQFDCLSSVTLSTHATVNFLKHLPTLVFGIYT